MWKMWIFLCPLQRKYWSATLKQLLKRLVYLTSGYNIIRLLRCMYSLLEKSGVGGGGGIYEICLGCSRNIVLKFGFCIYACSIQICIILYFTNQFLLCTGGSALAESYIWSWLYEDLLSSTCWETILPSLWCSSEISFWTITGKERYDSDVNSLVTCTLKAHCYALFHICNIH